MPVAHGVVTKQAFVLEAELAVEIDSRLVVGVHREFDPVQVHPVVGDVQRRRQQFRPDTLALPRDGDGHADTAGVGAADPRIVFQPEIANDHTLMQRHQLHHPFVIWRKAFAPNLSGLKRHLQHLPGHGRIVVQRGDALKVRLIEAFDFDGGSVVGHGRSFLDRWVAAYSKPLSLWLANIKMWERACSRKRSEIQHLCHLTHRLREQARSHRGLGVLAESGQV
ncbi:hypothetical protein EMIT093MI4_140049 [Pseudomonas sp. IT-93MI4]